MMKIDWKTRTKHPIFWVNSFLAIVVPILAYYGMNAKDFTTWESIFNVTLDALKNPYVLMLAIVSLWNNVINTTTKGISD